MIGTRFIAVLTLGLTFFSAQSASAWDATCCGKWITFPGPGTFDRHFDCNHFTPSTEEAAAMCTQLADVDEKDCPIKAKFCGRKCNTAPACKDVAKLQNLFDRYRDPVVGSAFASFATFSREFDKLLGRLSNQDLACRYDAGSGLTADVNGLVGHMLKMRNSFKTLTAISFVPIGPCSPNRRDECADHNALMSIQRDLGALADNLNCPQGVPGAAKRLGCPEMNGLKDIKERTETAAKVTQGLQRIAATKFAQNAALLEGLEGTRAGFEGVSNGLQKVINAGKSCENIRDLLNDLGEFKKAIDAINNSGCDSRKQAQGFDQLFVSAGKLGQRLPMPDLKPYFQMLAQNRGFFERTSGNINPEQRWADQFSNLGGYVPNCP